MGSSVNNPCPDEERLVDYTEGRLSEDDQSQIEEHLSECHLCLDTFILMREMAENLEQFELEHVPKRVTETAVDLVTKRHFKSSNLNKKIGFFFNETVSRIVETLPKPNGAMQPVLVRGAKIEPSDDRVCLTVTFKNIKTKIEIEKSDPEKVLIRVSPSGSFESIKGIRVTLKSGDREFASHRLIETYVVFEDIPFGHYSISLTDNGEELGSYMFEIKDSRYGVS
jgi:hypothetical protein